MWKSLSTVCSLKYWWCFSSLSTACSKNSVSLFKEVSWAPLFRVPTCPEQIKFCLWENNLSQEESEVPSSPEDIASSDQEINEEPDQEVSFHPSKAQQAIPDMFMPYIEGPNMDWIVNDTFYLRFVKWCLKCEGILGCELEALPEQQKSKKVIAWSKDFGMDQYVSWHSLVEELNLDTIWGKYEEFWKHKQMRCVPNLIFSQASDKEVEVWMNGTVQCKHKSILLNTP